MKGVDWIRSNLTVFSESGDEFACECPSCGDPKLWINVRKLRVICYKGCYSGSLAWLIKTVERCSFGEAEQKLEREAPRTIDDLRERLGEMSKGRDTGETELVSQSLPEEFEACFDGFRYRVPAYLEDPLPRGRDLPDNVLRRHGIGFALEGRYRNRAIIPVHCCGNKTFLARLMGKSRDFAWIDRNRKQREPAKYLSPKGANMGSYLYWFDNTPIGVDCLIVVEGVFDAIRLISLGFRAVANFGKHATDEQIALFARLRPKKLLFMYDGGATTDSRADAWRVKSKLPRMNIGVVPLTGEDDPDTIGATGGAKAIKSLLKQTEPVTNQIDVLRASIEGIR